MTGLTTINGTFAIDPTHSRLGFVVRHAMVSKVRGHFNEFEGTASGDGANPESAQINVTAQINSFDSGNAQRDEHVRGADFLDAETHPTLTFTSTDVKIVDEDTLEVTGDLTIKGTTQQVTIPFDFAGQAVDVYGMTRIGFEGTTKIKRSDFGLTWNAALETGGVMVSDDVTLEIEIAAVKQA